MRAFAHKRQRDHNRQIVTLFSGYTCVLLRNPRKELIVRLSRKRRRISAAPRSKKSVRGRETDWSMPSACGQAELRLAMKQGMLASLVLRVPGILLLLLLGVAI